MLYRQVYDHIMARMERGEWNAHDKLPSIRCLALELGVNRLTVFKAYQLLKQSGKAYVKEKSGYYVCSEAGSPFARGHDEQQKPPSSAVQMNSELSDIHKVTAAYQFSQAVIDPNLLPNLFLSEYVKKVFDIYPKLMGIYSTPQGDEELREVLSQYLDGPLPGSSAPKRGVDHDWGAAGDRLAGPNLYPANGCHIG